MGARVGSIGRGGRSLAEVDEAGEAGSLFTLLEAEVLLPFVNTESTKESKKRSY